MTREPEQSELFNSELAEVFDKLALDHGWLELDELGLNGFKALRKAFEAGVAHGRSLDTKKPLPAPGSPPRASGGHSGASLKQYGYLKALVAGDQAKALGMMSREQYEAIFSEQGLLSKGDASELIERLVGSGIRPKWKR